MFLHIGGEVMVPLKKVVLIINLENGSLGEATKEYLSLAADDKNVFYAGSKEKIRSVIITDESILYTPISVETLTKRSHGC
jgi:hypothetical protein